MKSLATTLQIEHRIYFIRGHKVMLDSDLSELYGVQTKYLNQAAKRNKDRFPLDFMFQLTTQEMENLRFQYDNRVRGSPFDEAPVLPHHRTCDVASGGFH